MREFKQLGQNNTVLITSVRESQAWLTDAAWLIPSVNVPYGCNPGYKKDSNLLWSYLKLRDELIEFLADASRSIPPEIYKRHVLSNRPWHAPGNNVEQITLIEWVGESYPVPVLQPFPHIPTAELDAPVGVTAEPPIVATPAVAPLAVEAKQPDPYAALRVFADNSLVGIQSKVIKVLCDKGAVSP